jgi:hypothetical protein
MVLLPFIAWARTRPHQADSSGASPPAGSRIKVEHRDGCSTIVIPHESAGVLRYLIAACLLVTLAKWAGSWVRVVSASLHAQGEGAVMVSVWIVLWTGCGALVVWFLYRLLSNGVPERLTLGQSSLTFDSGLQPTRVSINWRLNIQIADGWVCKRQRFEFSLQELSTLRLTAFPGGNRLTIDRGATQYPLGISLSPPESEWLYQKLRREYNLVNDAPRGAIPPPLPGSAYPPPPFLSKTGGLTLTHQPSFGPPEQERPEFRRREKKLKVLPQCSLP